jgi:hypothetical protein
MSTQAWIMLVITWTVTIAVTTSFLVRAATRPPDEDDES